jgi:GT2 family glycosyltransferase
VSWHVVVLSWNGREDTLACLESLRQVDAEVICVDNGSTDGTAAAVRERFPEVGLIENAENLGFAGGNNVGIRRALERGAEWVVLLNNDATLAPDAVDAFARTAREHPRAGILGGKVYFDQPPDRIWFAGQRVRLGLGYSWRPRGYRRPDGPKYSDVVPTDRAVGALLAASRQLIDRVGPLDEDLFAYVEDVDWCVRAREAGFEVLIAPDARAWHRVSASTGGEAATTHSLYYGTRNTIVVCERHRPLARPLAGLRRAVVFCTFALHALTRAAPWRAGPGLRAVREGYADARAGRLGKRRDSG